VIVNNETQTENEAYVETLDADGNFVYNLGEIQTITLPSGKELNVGSFSTEQKLHRFLSDPQIQNTSTKKGDGWKWIPLDRISFKSGSAELMPASKEQLHNITALMEEYPNAKIKIGGYTDNT